MTIRVALHHQSRYRFDRLVKASPHEIRLRPAVHSRTPVHGYSLKVFPEQHFIHWQQDAYGNFVARITFPEPTREIEITVDLIADMTVINPFDYFIEDWATHYPFQYQDQQIRDLTPFLEKGPATPIFQDYLNAFLEALPKDITTTDLLVFLSQRFHQDIGYQIRLESGVQTPEETLTLHSGSCRDSAWLMVQVLRHLGIAARFVSGYLIQLVPDIQSTPEAFDADFTDLHAWCEAYIPGAGWVGMDATSGLFAGEGHIPLAVSAQPTAAAPVMGMTTPCEALLDVVMTVSRIHEDPRVTKPYKSEEWASIMALGATVDEVLKAADVRLTQGGEPTFIARDPGDKAEWHTGALGEEKWDLALRLFRRLKEQFGQGGVIQFGQGKWYPGEPLPRWAMNLFWRTDGLPLWRHPSLLDPAPQETLDLGVIEEFGQRLCERLGLSKGYLIPAYEDPWMALDHESKLPVNVEADTTDLKDSANRQTLAKQLRQGILSLVGYVLPLKSEQKAGHPCSWRSSRWPLRHEQLFLLGGDSPMGLRLPLDRLPWVAPEDFEPLILVDPFMPRGPLAPHLKSTGDIAVPRSDERPKDIIHTALTLEIREGRVHLFLPPLERLEDFVDLMGHIEAIAVTMDLGLRLEGYAPPRDPRLTSLSVTPDPGVIEVNVHPSSDWGQLVALTQTLDEEARAVGLATEKFNLDGRHTGTGGGNHITLGAHEAIDSPFLRRPDVLVSLLTYWQQHPALSYLFSGAFIGPSSQAPRVDEARNDHLYELDIAFSEIARSIKPGEESSQPWLVDRLLRHLLTDMTGNTHRAEFCIDKLYSPDSPTGRLGILELRAFEMAPHYQMNLLQALLLRALVARFWTMPYRGPLVAWGTQLHDKFMLPSFIERDIAEVVRDLGQGGFPFEMEWFQPFLAFRCPSYGEVVHDGISLSLRQAIEPWHVLGEEVAAGATARYVDSSVERIEVRVRGLTETRHQVICNGRVLPLHPTGVPGEFIAGIRFKAWAPPSGLHPTMGVQSPLIFDLYDRWNQRSLGGCTYHVSHPGGRNFKAYPVNAQEAESRRRARFWGHGHTPGPMTISQEPLNPHFPMTLDLRWTPY